MFRFTSRQDARRLFRYLLVTHSSCCVRHFQVEPFEWTAVKRCWGGGGGHRPFHMPRRHDGGHPWRLYSDLLLIFFAFKMRHPESNIHQNCWGPFFPGKKTLKKEKKESWINQENYMAPNNNDRNQDFSFCVHLNWDIDSLLPRTPALVQQIKRSLFAVQLSNQTALINRSAP